MTEQEKQTRVEKPDLTKSLSGLSSLRPGGTDKPLVTTGGATDQGTSGNSGESATPKQAGE